MNMEEKIIYAAQAMLCKPDLPPLDQNKTVIAVLRRGTVKAIPTNQCHLAKSDDDTLIITPHPKSAAHMHLASKKPIWLYDKATDLVDIRQSVQEISEFVIVTANPQEKDIAYSEVEKWSRKDPNIRVISLSADQEIEKFNQHYKFS